MSTSFLRGATVGLVCAVIGGGAVAFAGSGVGGVFNLGQSNSVDAQTSLTGASRTAQLQVTNTNAVSGAAGLKAGSASGSPTASFTNGSSGNGVLVQSAGPTNPALVAKNTGGGPAASFAVNSGVSPFKVSSSVKVVNLNADLLDGYDVSHIMSGGGRVGESDPNSVAQIELSAAPVSQASVSLTAPSSGFALVQGSVDFSDAVGARCNVCRVGALLQDATSGASSLQAVGSLGNGTDLTFAPIQVQWVFPVTAGAHSYTLETVESDTGGGPAGAYNAVATAEFIPFGHDGGSSLRSAAGSTKVVPPSPATGSGPGVVASPSSAH